MKNSHAVALRVCWPNAGLCTAAPLPWRIPPFLMYSFVHASVVRLRAPPTPHTQCACAFSGGSCISAHCSSPLFFASRCAHRLLSLGIQNIHIGPAAPAFVTPGILKVLQDKYKLQYIDSENYEADLQKMLQGM
eukprot:TRINITY_DN25_c0_g1_i10.p1 TRINITY_DN25_c0_g1~~TRINITY_DN25_c0_g1_i10.p1  ORF type:complete len:134 (+),score=23.09 TRINITY_DN25_c0_g1_i10:364-765(+)